MRSRALLPPAALTLVAALLAAASPAFPHDDVAPTLRALDAAVARTPGDAALWLRRAELARLAGDPAAASAALDRAQALAPASARVPLVRAALAFDRGDDAAAAAALAVAFVRGLPADAEAPARLLAARVAARQGDTDAALDAYARAFAADPAPRADVALEHAAFALAAGRAAAAAAALDAALARLPEDPALRETRNELARAAAARDFALPAPAPAPVLSGAPVAAAAAAARPPGDATFASLPLVPRNSTWRWATPGAALPGWADPAFDDSGWSAGPGALGFGDPFIATAVAMGPDASTRWTTTYFRRTFTLADPPASLTGLTLNVNYDDGFLLRLNGQEIARRALPAGAIAYGTFASNHEGGAYETIDVTAALPALVAGTNVLAVEVHQATSTSSDLAWDGELLAATGAANVTRGPYLQDATPAAITLRWRTSVATDSRAWIGAAPGALSVAATDGALTTEHELRVSGLAPESTVYYAVGSTAGPLAGDDAQHAFRTPPPAGAARPTRIWVLGDSGLPGAAQDRVRDAYAAWADTTRTDVWLMLGDNAYTAGTDADYGAGLFTPYAAFLRGHCLWPTRGNHDVLYAGGGNDYYDLFTLPVAGEAGGLASETEAWYAFDHGDVHFVCLDSEGSSRAPGSAMLTWLAADLAATDRRWVIVFWHHPPYTKGSHDSDNVADSGGRMRDMRENVMPILEAYGVDLVLCGHSHSYERSYLLDGHYGTSGTLLPSMILDAGDGDPAGDGAYVKASGGQAPHEGEVVAVAGSSAQTSGGALNHPAMVRSLNVLGSLVLDLDGAELQGTFLDDVGAVRDRFAIRKGAVAAGAPRPPRGAGLALAVAGANPARGGALRFACALPHAGAPSLSVVDAAGRRVRALPQAPLAAGTHVVTWDGNDESGRRAPAGLYFALLDLDGARATARVVVLP